MPRPRLTPAQILPGWIPAHAPGAKQPWRPGPPPNGPAPPASPLPLHLRARSANPAPSSLFSPVAAGVQAGVKHATRTLSTRALAQQVGAEMAKSANPDKRPMHELQRLYDPRSRAPLGTITRHPHSATEALQQIFRAGKITPPGMLPVALNLSERKDHPPGIKHVTDHFPPGVPVRVGPYSVTRTEQGTRALGPNARGQPMQAHLSTLRITDTRTGRHFDARHIDVENFGDGSTPSRQALRKLDSLLPPGVPLVVNCEVGIGRSAMVWMIHNLLNYIHEQNKLGRHVTRRELCNYAMYSKDIVHDQRGQALLPDARQDAAALEIGLEALEHQSVAPPSARPPAHQAVPRLAIRAAG
ncbi:MAG: hypothetical protein KA795_06305 [Burkholderiaceae bacterium]|nr:hypothetical protein [Burkholderiaceae bacterium]